MRICEVTAIFVVFEKFGIPLLVLKLNFQAVIKSAASAASLGTKHPRKNRSKIDEKIAFLGLLYRDPFSDWAHTGPAFRVGRGVAAFSPAR